MCRGQTDQQGNGILREDLTAGTEHGNGHSARRKRRQIGTDALQHPPWPSLPHTVATGPSRPHSVVTLRSRGGSLGTETRKELPKLSHVSPPAHPPCQLLLLPGPEPGAARTRSSTAGREAQATPLPPCRPGVGAPGSARSEKLLSWTACSWAT